MSKIANFSYWGSSPSKFCNGGSAEKKLDMPLRTRRWKEFDDLCIFFNFHTIPERNGQTDGFAITISHSACIVKLTRDKKTCSLSTTYNGDMALKTIKTMNGVNVNMLQDC